jgi:hypothetical protein
VDTLEVGLQLSFQVYIEHGEFIRWQS